MNCCRLSDGFCTSLLLLIRMSNSFSTSISSRCSSCCSWAGPTSDTSTSVLWATHFIPYLQHSTVCITKQVLRIFLCCCCCWIKFLKFTWWLFATLSVANEGKALYCHPACNKECKHSSFLSYIISCHSRNLMIWWHMFLFWYCDDWHFTLPCHFRCHPFLPVQ